MVVWISVLNKEPQTPKGAKKRSLTLKENTKRKNNKIINKQTINTNISYPPLGVGGLNY